MSVGLDDTAVNVRFCVSPGPADTLVITTSCGPASSFTTMGSSPKSSNDGGSLTLVIVNTKSSVTSSTPSLTVTTKVAEPETFGFCVIKIVPVPRSGTTTGAATENNVGLSWLTVTLNASSWSSLGEPSVMPVKSTVCTTGKRLLSGAVRSAMGSIVGRSLTSVTVT